MGKIKSHTVTNEYDEKGNLASTWETTEYYPEPDKTEGKSVKHLMPGQADFGYVLNLPPEARCSGNCFSHGSLRS